MLSGWEGVMGVDRLMTMNASLLYFLVPLVGDHLVLFPSISYTEVPPMQTSKVSVLKSHPNSWCNSASASCVYFIYLHHNQDILLRASQWFYGVVELLRLLQVFLPTPMYHLWLIQMFWYYLMKKSLSVENSLFFLCFLGRTCVCSG